MPPAQPQNLYESPSCKRASSVGGNQEPGLYAYEPDFSYLPTSGWVSDWKTEIAAGWVAHAHYRSPTDQGFMSRKEVEKKSSGARQNVSMSVPLCKESTSQLVFLGRAGAPSLPPPFSPCLLTYIFRGNV